MHLRMQQEEAERELKQPKSIESQREEMRRLNMIVKEKQDQEIVRQRLQGDQEEGKAESQQQHQDAVQQQQQAEVQKAEELKKVEPVSRVPLQEKEKATVKKDKTEETLKTRVDNKYVRFFCFRFVFPFHKFLSSIIPFRKPFTSTLPQDFVFLPFQIYL